MKGRSDRLRVHAPPAAGATGVDPLSLPAAVLAEQPCIQLVHTSLEDLAYLEMVLSFLQLLPTLVTDDFPQVGVLSFPCLSPIVIPPTSLVTLWSDDLRRQQTHARKHMQDYASSSRVPIGFGPYSKCYWAVHAGACPGACTGGHSGRCGRAAAGGPGAGRHAFRRPRTRVWGSGPRKGIELFWT